MTNTQIQQALKKIYTQMQIKELLPAQEYQIFIKPNFYGATWRFHQGKHKIVIGENLTRRMDKNSNKTGKLDYLRSFLYHELAHSLWSPKDIESLSKNLSQECVSFGLYNLFEDARIEEKMRLYMKHHFRWTYYETLAIPQNAIEIFFYILQSEHKADALKALRTGIPEELTQQLYTIFEYYKRVLAVEDINDLINIMIEWYQDFPLTEAYLEPFTQSHNLFVLDGFYSKDINEFEELIENLEDIIGKSDTSLNIFKKNSLDDIQHRATQQGNGAYLLLDEEQYFDINTKEEEEIYNRISTLFEDKNRGKYHASSLPSKRLNIKGLMQKSQKRYKRKEEAIITVVPTITLIVDMSGSMLNIVNNMQMILRVFNKLASKNIINCKLILSGTVAGTSQFQLLTLPLEDSIIHKIYPRFSGEGISHSMKNNIKQLRQSDYVWVLTDGCITNDEIDKKYFNKLGVKTHAFYIGSNQYQETMQKYFDFVICQENTDGLINEILTLIK